MSTIKIKGYASRKMNADMIKYTISFMSKNIKTYEASEQTKSQCEAFLNNMKDLSFDVSKFHLEGDNIHEEYNSDEKIVSRYISFDFPFDPKINNAIYSIIKKEDLNVEAKTDFYLSNKKRIHEELLKEALLDSKRKAEMIASANNQKVKYAELITDARYSAENDDKNDEGLILYEEENELDDDSLSAELSAKQIEEWAELYVTWVIA